MSLRTIQHPGCEIREVDVSNVAPNPAGTYCFLAGYADKGENYEPQIGNNIDDVLAYYGKPTNEAERYFYYSAEEIIRNGGTLVASKLPYDNVICNTYRGVGLSFSSSPNYVSGILSSAVVSASGKLRAAGATETSGGYYTKYSTLTTSKVDLTLNDYDLLESGAAWSSLSGSLGSNDFIIVNTSKDTVNGPLDNESLFISIIDPLDGLKAQRIMPIASYTNKFSGEVTTMQKLSGVTINGINYVVDSDYDFSRTANIDSDSYSEMLAKNFPTIDFDGSTGTINKEYSNYIGVLVCKTFTDQYSAGKLKVSILESFNGSIHRDARDLSSGVSQYIGDMINMNSQYIKWYGDIDITDITQGSSYDKMRTDKGIDDTVVIYNPEFQTYPLLGFTKSETVKSIIGTQIGSKLITSLNKVSNIDDIQLDLVIDGGISTIAQFTSVNTTTGEIFDPRKDVDSDAQVITDGNIITAWRDIVSQYIEFCRDTRKDCMTILDVPRNLVLQGDAKYIRKSAPTNTFASTIGKNIRFVTGLNSSYAALYTNWFKQVDKFTGINFWIPQSVKMAGIYCYNDRTANIWDAPAGLNRGVINGVNDIAFNPDDKAMDQLYIKSLNYAKKYPLDGFIAEGQKTTQTKPSAFDRVNVRRLFLRLERLVYRAARYFVYEPNSIYTRRRLVDTIRPIFDSYRSQGGIFDYQILCSEKNNTAQVIDNNELKVAILIKPTRTAEFILVDFYATRTDANFSEILQQVV